MMHDQTPKPGNQDYETYRLDRLELMPPCVPRASPADDRRSRRLMTELPSRIMEKPCLPEQN